MRGAIGVVFGDIGTSPLYTLRASISADPGAIPARDDVLGVLSLVFWALTMVVTVKYLLFVMRADNRGEGGIFALLALVPKRARRGHGPHIGHIALLVIAGAALLYGDGIITPAISVLSAVEGLEIAAPVVRPAVVPITCVVLLALFVVQRRGTGGIGTLFGPVMVVWFLTIGALGLVQVARNPLVMAALSPMAGARYFAHHGLGGVRILGVVVLAITGGEALYADMGHFSARPIRLAWLGLVFPSLVLSYFGQGALLLGQQGAVANPFFAMVPGGPWTFALVLLSTAATVIASQALITGVFSLTHQAVQLGFFPRVTITHTSSQTEGQIYVPEINWGLAIASIALVLSFKESSRLAAAYGIAVSGTMAITSIVYYVVTRRTWKWPLYASLPLLVLFLSFDVPFFAANLLKFVDGGYVPILVGAAIAVVMIDWRLGRSVLAEYIAERSPPLDRFVADLDRMCAVRLPGTAVFLAGQPNGVPPVLYQYATHIGSLRENVIVLTVTTEHVPYVADGDRFEVKDLGKGLWRVFAHTGFMEQPRVPQLLSRAREEFAMPIDVSNATYFVGRETFLVGRSGTLKPLAEGLFAFLTRNARSATSYFAIPPAQVVELGMQIDL
jgi:KUP system potassium uptake protein